MHRLFAERLVFMTGLIVILMSIVFALLRMPKANNDIKRSSVTRNPSPL
jgi:hypothetical protein